MNHRVEKLMSERQSLQERVNTLQRGLAQIETEKREQEREQIRLEKDKAALQKTLDKVCMVFLQLLWNHSFFYFDPKGREIIFELSICLNLVQTITPKV